MMERLQIRASALAAEADEKQQCVLNARSELVRRAKRVRMARADACRAQAAQTATVDAMLYGRCFGAARTHR